MKQRPRFLLDTNIVSDIARPRPNPGIATRLNRYAGELAIAATTWQELVFGAVRAPAHSRPIIDRALRLTRRLVVVLPYEVRAAQWHAEQRARLHPVTPPQADTLIAAVAAVNNLTLVTHNTRDFTAFSDLQLEAPATLSLLSEVDPAGQMRHLTTIRAGGKKYRLSPPVPYTVRSEGIYAFAESEEFHLYADGETPDEAAEELQRHLAALVEGYALESDARLAKSGQELKQRLLARLKRV